MRIPRWAAPAVAAGTAALLGSAAALASPIYQGNVVHQQEIPDGKIQVRGRILFIDRDSDRSHSAAGLRVEIWDKDERGFTTAELLGQTVTNAGGYFESGMLDNTDRDGPSGQLEGTQDVFLKLFTNNGTVRLLEEGSGREFGWASYEVDARDGLRRNVPDGEVPFPALYLMESTRDVEALWSFVNLVEGWQFLKDRTERDPGPVLAYWSNINRDGPRYDPVARAIHLRDADAGYGSVVLQQEAYALLHNAVGTLPAAWMTCTAGPTEDLRSAVDPACAFVGGFATFFALAVRGDPEFASLAIQGANLDTLAAGAAGWSDGDTVPGRVAGAFWDLHDADTTEEFFDLYNASFGDIWEVMAVKAPETFAQWWAGWLALGKDGCRALGSLFQNTIDYNTAPNLAAINPIRMGEDTVVTIDLASLATDAECPDEELFYLLPEPGDPNAGVTLTPAGLLTVAPVENWFGSTVIRLAVSDGPATAEQTIPVVVESVNDVPVIAPRIQDREVRHGEPIAFDLAGRATDVEDAAALLTWDVELEPDDIPVIQVEGRGTNLLTFRLNAIVTEERSVRIVIIARDTEGGEGRQPVVLKWTPRPNNPPFIWPERLIREYEAAKNHNIVVDLTGVAGDSEDDANLLTWYAREVDHAQIGGEGSQLLEFDPDVDYVGPDVVTLEVRDLQGASASGTITLTWTDPAGLNNQPPRILRNLLHGKTVGTNGSACYSLADKAVDSDDPPQSLRWFATEYDGTDLRVNGQGTQQLCLLSRPEFRGCHEATFVVVDPKGAEDSEPIRSCWRPQVLYLPNISTKMKVR